jgi:hypothetical protein
LPISTLTSDDDARYDEEITFTATLQAPGGGTPQGSVTFYDGTNALDTEVLQNGNLQASYTTTLSYGTHSITAVYSDTVDGNFATITSSVLSQFQQGS